MKVILIVSMNNEQWTMNNEQWYNRYNRYLTMNNDIIDTIDT